MIAEASSNESLWAKDILKHPECRARQNIPNNIPIYPNNHPIILKAEELKRQAIRDMIVRSRGYHHAKQLREATQSVIRKRTPRRQS